MDFDTLHKDPLYKGKVYPVTPAILREKLAEVPQKADVVVYYSNFSVSEHRVARNLRGQDQTKQPRFIILARYSCNDISIPKGRNSEPLDDVTAPESAFERLVKPRMWAMDVSAIPLEHLNLVRESLEKEGYAKFVDWFVEKDKKAGSFGRSRFGLSLRGTVLEYIESNA